MGTMKKAKGRQTNCWETETAKGDEFTDAGNATQLFKNWRRFLMALRRASFESPSFHVCFCLHRTGHSTLFPINLILLCSFHSSGLETQSP